MAFRRCPRREGKSTWEAHDRQQNKGRQPVAIMKDGSIIEIRDLQHQVDLAKSGNVELFTFRDKLSIDWAAFDEAQEKRYVDDYGCFFIKSGGEHMGEGGLTLAE